MEGRTKRSQLSKTRVVSAAIPLNWCQACLVWASTGISASQASICALRPGRNVGEAVEAAFRGRRAVRGFRPVQCSNVACRSWTLTGSHYVVRAVVGAAPGDAPPDSALAGPQIWCCAAVMVATVASASLFRW